MTKHRLLRWTWAACCSLAGLFLCGCQAHQHARMLYQPPPPAAPLGTISDPIWQSQEARAEASEFVVYQHEFKYNTDVLNHCGKEHVKQIAARLCYNPHIPVIVERSLTTPDPDTEYEYPVHPNPELDMRRREAIVRSLAIMGVPCADQRVVVSFALDDGFTATEAQQIYNQALSGGGFGGGFGGGGGLGGGFGGGFGLSPGTGF